ncbi:hypothetical protein Golax_022490 [Gossypium laxum]|uniref:Uncharacterized protein n=1 Tax=Gossypium laxum TaxID=34288 RepID=A0A7J9B087_9ROSI|nr:hypothetical protein [Gossypium laxum]
MALVVSKYMAIGSFSKKTVDIDLDDGNQDLVPINCNNEEVEEIVNALEQFTVDKTPIFTEK